MQFNPGENAQSLGLMGFETYNTEGVSDDLQPLQEVTVRARDVAGDETTFNAVVRINSLVEVTYYHNGGILNAVLHQMAQS